MLTLVVLCSNVSGTPIISVINKDLNQEEECSTAFFALIRGKELAVLGHGDGEAASARPRTSNPVGRLQKPPF